MTYLQQKKTKKISQIASGKIPFNKWSQERIKQGRKTRTSRHKMYLYDERVISITPKLSWKYIKKHYWKEEGADSPEELQQVIEEIYKRKVPDDEEFYNHLLDFKIKKTRVYEQSK